MRGRDVVITGIGLYTGLGTTAGETLAAWRDGRSVEHQPVPDLARTPLESMEIGVLPEWDVSRLKNRRMAKYMSVGAVLGCLAGSEAAEDAALNGRFPPERVGLFAATGLAAISLDDTLPMIRASIDEDGRFSTRLLGQIGLAATNPLISFRILSNMPPCILSIVLGIKGPSFIFTPAEDQAGAALLEAWRAVSSGEVDAALAGGADNAAAYPSTQIYLRQAGRIREDEFVSSGAAYLVLEPAETAYRDGRRPYARVMEMDLSPEDGPAHDPLADRLGRSLAAAPATLLALTAGSRSEGRPMYREGCMTSSDVYRFRFVLEALP